MPDNLYRRGKIWWGRIQRGGAEHRRSLRTADKAEARRRLKAWGEDVAHAAFYGEARHTYREAVVRWDTEWLPGNVAPRTADRYRLSLKALDPHFAALYVDQITAKEIAKWVSRRKRDGVTNATVRRDLTALSTILTCCCAWAWREDNPAKAFDRNIIRERRDPILLPSDGTVLAVILEAPPMMGRLLLTLLQTGARLEEMGGLERRQMVLPRKQLAIEKTKGGRSRLVDLSDATVATLAAIPIGTKSGTAGTGRKVEIPWVFWHDDGRLEPNGIRIGPTRYVSLSSNLRKLIHAVLNPPPAKDEEPPEPFPVFRVHDLRHRFAVDWLRAGKDIYDLKLHLGHTSVKTTEIYLEYLARNPAQHHRFDHEWPFAKPLMELDYQTIAAYRPMAEAAVL
jgi:site-specific recombinase XerD